MHITELDSYRLGDAVKFHNRLNPKLWGPDEHLLPDVQAKLMEIAADFQEFLGVSDLDVEDITISGSNAAFSYTPHSDIDLHLVVRKPADASEVYQELFNAKKYQYNDMHDIRIHGADVELYVQDADKTPVSLGEYSIKNSDWIQVPKKKRAQIDQSVVRHKYEDLVARIQEALKTDDADHISSLLTKIKTMRQTGLDQHGEFGPENLAFKILRKQGYIQKLYAAQAAARDRELSLQERNRPKQRVRYGFAEDNTGMAQGSSIGDSGAQSTWDGVSPDTDETLTEDSNENIVQDFIQDTAHRLGIERMPQVELHQDSDWSRSEHSFGMYEPGSHTLHVNMANRHLMDILRTTAHELTHCRQHEISPLPDQAGETGSKWENQANATAGIIMRDYAEAHPELFEKDAVAESSGYIPTAKQKNDPRFKTALTVDIRPGATGREANKMALQTDAQGRPGLLIRDLKNALREFKETGRLARIKEMDRLGNQDVTGPETPPTMPAGTVKVDVSDVYDWYKLGQHISNMKGLGKHDFGAGPPSAIISFGDEETEHKYIKDLEKTGLSTTDIDPIDANQPPGMKRQKTDPTYNVTEAFDKPYELLRWETGDFGDVDAIARLDDNTFLSIMFNKGVSKDSKEEAWSVEFYRNNSQEVTGEGDAQRVFATVLSAIQTFIKKYKPNRVIFSASKEVEDGQNSQSRARLYDSLVQRYARAWGFRAFRADTSNKVIYELNRIQQRPVAENLHQEFALLEDEYLGEIKMTGKNLRAEAAKTGAIAGMEFEMIVPNVEGGDADGQMEADYSLDEGITSIQEAYDFFYDGDYNSRGDVTRLRDKMTNEYYEWLSEQFDTRWDSDEFEFVYNYLVENASGDEIAEILGTEPNEDGEYPDPNKQSRVDAADKVVEEGYGNYWYDQARESAQEDFNQNADLESEWLESRDLNTMQDIENEYNMNWPHWYSQGGGEASIEDIAQEFENAIDRPVRASSNYHSGSVQRPSSTSQHYIVEPDGSLEPDDSDDVGLEFVSPPLPIDDILSDLNKVKAWAKQYGCYTNDSTGLHINISVPNYTLAKLDYVKLALLMGDEYVLDLFGRSGNTYAKSAISKIKTMLQRNPDIAPKVMDKMREHMEDLATKAIHSGTTDKYTSINTKNGYIEFRSPGGDWLDENFDKIENTLLRFTVALSAAIDPEAYRQEYLKKLYKLLEGSQEKGGPDVLQLFANYSAGELDKAALIRQVRQKQLARGVTKGKITGKMWWRVGRPGYGASAEVVASDKEEAIAKGKQEYPDWADAQDMTATPLRPYQEAESSGPTLNGRPSNPGGNWVIVDRQAPRTPVFRYMAADGSDALLVLRQWITANPGGEWTFVSDADQSLGQPGQPSAQQEQGNWGIWINALDRFANEPGSYARNETPAPMRFSSREATEQWIDQQRVTRPNLRNDIEVREIEPAVQDTGSATSGNWGIWVAMLGRFAEINDQGTARPRRFSDQAGAQAWIQDYNSRNPGNELALVAQEIEPSQAADENTNGLTPTGSGPWEVANRNNNQVYYNPPSSNPIEAESQSRTWLRQNGHSEADFEVRTREGVDSDTTQGGIIDIGPDISQYTAPGSTTDLAQQRAAGGFTGAWKVTVDGEEVYRFSGIGNNQADANRVGREWARNQISQGLLYPAGDIEIVPIMGNA